MGGDERHQLAVIGGGLAAGPHRALPGQLAGDYDIDYAHRGARAAAVLVVPAAGENLRALLDEWRASGEYAGLPAIVVLPVDDDAAAEAIGGLVWTCLLPREASARVLRAVIRGAIEAHRDDVGRRPPGAGFVDAQGVAEARAALRASEEHLRIAQSVAGLGTMSYDWATDTLDCDDRAAAILGLERGASLRDVFGRIHPDDRATARRAVQTAASGNDREDEYDWDSRSRIVWRDGSMHSVEARTRIHFEGRGAQRRPVQALITVLDRTAQQAAEEALRESEERLSILANLAPVYVWIADRAGTITFTSASWLQYTGLTFEENQQWPERVVHPDDAERVALTWQRALDTGAEYQIEVRNRRHDGAYRWMETRAVPVRDRRGTVTSWLGATTDIDERRLSEERVRESEELLRLALDVGEIGIATIDIEAQVAYWSPRARAIFDLDDERTPFMVLSERVHPDDRERAGAAIRGSWDPEAPEQDYHGEYRVVWRDGSVHWVNRRWRVFFQGSGAERRAARVLVTVQDVTERRTTEERLREREAWLAGQREALEAALDGAPLEHSLNVLMRTAIAQLGDGVRAAFYLDPGNGASLRHIVGLTDGHAEAGDGPESLGAAPGMREATPVLTSDVDQDPRWEAWRSIAATFGYRACWTFPIHTSKGVLVGTFAVYWTQPREATPRELSLAELMTQTAGIIVAQHRSDQALLESRHLLQEALDAGALGTWSFDARSGEFTWDARMHELWDLGAEEAPSAELMLARTHPDDRPSREHLARLRGQADPTERVFRIVRPSGEVRWLQSVGRTERDESDSVMRITGHVRDITLGRQAIQSLREREQQLQVALELGELGTIARAEDETSLTVDARARRIYGMAADEEAHAGLILERTHPEDRARLAEDQRRVRDPSSDGYFQGTYRVVWPDGTVRWVERKVLMTFEGEGVRRRPVRGIATLRDITEQRRLETAQRDFLAMASHELRNPIAALMGNAQLLLRRGNFDRETAEVIVGQARHLERLVRDLLDVTAMATGQFRLRRASVDLVSIATEIASELQGGARMHRVHVRRGPDAAPGSWDGDRLRQVVRNLVSNAIKYSPDGGEVAIDIEEAGGDVRLSVEDHGIGIPEEEQERIFGRFYRSDSGSGRIDGLGLGLDVTKALVEAHGGSIDVASSPGAGSTFTVTLPRGEAPESRDGTAEARSAAEADPDRHARVLIADDDPAIRRLLTRALSGEGYEAAAVADGVEALTALEETGYDALLLDMMMPRLDGPGLVQELRRRGIAANMPIVVVSANHAARTLAEQLEAQAVLEKPFDLTRLIDTLARLIAAR
ncbi:MAG: PAS domain-containing protein [Dehalococcoidia bacterium]